MREEKRWLCHGEMAEAIFLLAAKVICAPSVIKAEQNTSSTRRNIPQLESENIRESILNFTARFGETNHDMPYLCRLALSESKRVVFAFFPLFGEG